MSAPKWKDALPAPQPGARLLEAWFTTFDQPDAGLLVEHILPSLLGLSHTPTQDLQERGLFFGELGTMLEVLRGRLSVISSPPRTKQERGQYPWLWRYVSHFTVGSNGPAVQHAKLWAFHWKSDKEEHLELHVSSTNLTTSALKDQIQAGWRTSLQLEQRPTQANRRSWGDLIPFIESLGTSAGDVATMRLERLVVLLSRAICPKDVTFIASIPGGKSATRQLQEFNASEVHVLAPTIGEWNNKTLSAWSSDIGISPRKIHLKWISRQHPWADGNKWALSKTACEALNNSGVQLQCLPDKVGFTESHPDEDRRWSHAKLYLFRRGQQRYLLVTSANWSESAWGAGKKPPRNFELGVVFKPQWRELEDIGSAFSGDADPFCIEEERKLEEAKLQWAESSWDGKHIKLRARSTDSSTEITVTIVFSDQSERHLSLASNSSTLPWTSAQHTPQTARFMQGSEALEVPILDLRSPTDFAITPLPEVDPALSDKLREAFLLQRYGGPAVEADPVSRLFAASPLPSISAPTADYSVQAWLDARAAFNVIDSWRAALAEARSDISLFERVRLDGEELCALYERRRNVAAALAAEELRWCLAEK